MSGDIESRLRDKAEKYEVRNAENQIHALKMEIESLKTKVHRLEYTTSNTLIALKDLLRVMAENPNFQDMTDHLYNLHNSL